MIHELGELRSSDGSTLLKMWKVSVQPGVRPLVRHSHIRFEITLITSGSGIYAGMAVYAGGLAVSYLCGFVLTWLFGSKNVDLS